MNDNINVCQIAHNTTVPSQKYIFTKYWNKQNISTLITIEASPNVKKLIGHANVFNIHFIGELKTRNISQRIKNAKMSETVEFHISGKSIFSPIFVKSIFIPMFVGCQSAQTNCQFIQLRTNNNAPDITTFAIRFFISFIDCYNI